VVDFVSCPIRPLSPSVRPYLAIPAVLELVSTNQLAPNARHAPQTPSYALQPTVARSDGMNQAENTLLAPTRDTLPQRPQRPRVPDAMQRAHLDRQITLSVLPPRLPVSSGRFRLPPFP